MHANRRPARWASTPVNQRKEAEDPAHTSAPRAPEGGETTNQTRGSNALGRPSLPTGPAAGVEPQSRWCEPGQAASETMGNVTWSHGSNQRQASRFKVQEGVACKAERPRNSSHKNEAIVS